MNLIFSAFECYVPFMENTATCCSCLKTKKPAFICGICQSPICKSCVHFVDEHAVSFFAKTSPELTHPAYCGDCFSNTVQPHMAIYEEVLEKAKLVTVFFKDQRKRTRLMNRNEKVIQVKDCSDKEETLMRLAFLASEANFNSLIDVDITFVKTKINFYQTSLWQGSAIPVNLNAAQLKRE